MLKFQEIERDTWVKAHLDVRLNEEYKLDPMLLESEKLTAWLISRFLTLELKSTVVSLN